MIEVHEHVIGAAAQDTGAEPDGTRIYWHSCRLLPEWTGCDIEQVLFHHNEHCLRACTHEFPNDKTRLLRVGNISAKNTHTPAILQSRGYAPVRHSFHMLRPTLDNIPNAPLPPGIEVRPSHPDHARALWDANVEAFRDHWGFHEPPPNGFDLWRNNPHWLHGLPRIAWADDQVAGMVRVFIPPTPNPPPPPPP